MTEETKSSSPLLVALAWAIVVLPAGWGLKYTVQNAAKLFTAPAASAAPSSAPSAPASSVPK